MVEELSSLYLFAGLDINAENFIPRIVNAFVQSR